jgi:hypothetical protein
MSFINKLVNLTFHAKHCMKAYSYCYIVLYCMYDNTVVVKQE